MAESEFIVYLLKNLILSRYESSYVEVCKHNQIESVLYKVMFDIVIIDDEGIRDKQEDVCKKIVNLNKNVNILLLLSMDDNVPSHTTTPGLKILTKPFLPLDLYKSLDDKLGSCISSYRRIRV